MKIHCSEIKLVPLKDLKVNPRNTNEHTPEQIERIAELMKYNGVRQVIKVSNRSGFISAGEGRYLAAKLLKLKVYPVSFQDYDSEEHEIADMNADNAVAKWSEINKSKVNDILADMGPDFNLKMLGFYEDFQIDLPNVEIDGNLNSDTIHTPTTESPTGAHKGIFTMYVVFNKEDFDTIVAPGLAKYMKEKSLVAQSDAIIGLIHDYETRSSD